MDICFILPQNRLHWRGGYRLFLRGSSKEHKLNKSDEAIMTSCAKKVENTNSCGCRTWSYIYSNDTTSAE